MSFLRRYTWLPAILLTALLMSSVSGCNEVEEVFGLDDDGPTPTPTYTPTPTFTPTPTPTPTPAGPTEAEIVWLDADVSSWPITTQLTVTIGGGQICFNFDATGRWPSKDVYGKRLNANPWVVAKLDGTWYAGTIEWMRANDTCKGTRIVNGDHAARAPLNGWSPRSGDTLGFMVSTLARHGFRSSNERSNVFVTKWP